MTLRELMEAIEGLPQRPGDTKVYVEDQLGELHELVEFGTDRYVGDDGEFPLVMKFAREAADV